MRFGFIQGVATWEKAVATAIKFIQLQAGCHCVLFTSDKEAFLYIRLIDRQVYSSGTSTMVCLPALYDSPFFVDKDVV